MKKHSLLNELKRLGLIKNHIKLIHHGVRDDKNIDVFACLDSGIIFLGEIKETDYSSLDDLSYWGVKKPDWKKIINEDDKRRYQLLKPIIKNKIWLDVGTGLGGVLHLGKKNAKKVYALEPQKAAQEWLKQSFSVFSSLEECPDNTFDIITLFHVFEHITEPDLFLKNAYKKLKKGGIIIIEVPHAKDALLDLYQSESFKKFTFWSQHLLLHTKKSLEHYLKVNKFKSIKVQGFQRYNLANHLYWLSHNSPGGHEKWKNIFPSKLEKEYSSFLAEKNMTDTIIAFAKK